RCFCFILKHHCVYSPSVKSRIIPHLALVCHLNSRNGIFLICKRRPSLFQIFLTLKYPYLVIEALRITDYIGQSGSSGKNGINLSQSLYFSDQFFSNSIHFVSPVVFIIL